jgi:hypothetical protein
LVCKLPRDGQEKECHDHGRPGEESEDVGADSLAAEVEDAAGGVGRLGSDPEVVEEVPERWEDWGG